MTVREPSAAYATHEVLKQPGELADYDAYGSDRAQCEAVEAFGVGWANPRRGALPT